MSYLGAYKKIHAKTFMVILGRSLASGMQIFRMFALVVYNQTVGFLSNHETLSMIPQCYFVGFFSAEVDI